MVPYLNIFIQGGLTAAPTRAIINKSGKGNKSLRFLTLLKPRPPEVKCLSYPR